MTTFRLVQCCKRSVCGQVNHIQLHDGLLNKDSCALFRCPDRQGQALGCEVDQADSAYSNVIAHAAAAQDCWWKA